MAQVADDDRGWQAPDAEQVDCCPDISLSGHLVEGPSVERPGCNEGGDAAFQATMDVINAFALGSTPDVVLDEPLPDPSELEDMTRKLFEAAKLEAEDDIVASVVEAIQGLPLFQAEQVVAMAIDPGKSIDIDAVWDRKRQQIEMTPGLSVSRDGTTFADIGGVAGNTVWKIVREIIALTMVREGFAEM